MGETLNCDTGVKQRGVSDVLNGGQSCRSGFCRVGRFTHDRATTCPLSAVCPYRPSVGPAHPAGSLAFRRPTVAEPTALQ